MKKSDIKLVFFGTPDFSATVLEKLIANFEVIAVVTNPDAPVGRDQVMTASPVAKLAESHQIKALKPSEIISKDLPAADVYVVFAYGKILPAEALKVPVHGAINIHTSLLPKYRGTAPIQAAILNGDLKTGVTLIQMDDKMDHGPILASQSLTIQNDDTLQSMTAKMAELGGDLVVKILPDYIEDKITPTVQDESEVSYTWKKAESKERAYFDLQNPPSLEKLDLMSRAFYPWPNAWTNWNGKIVKFYPNQTVQMEGKKIVSFEEFLRGYPDFPLRLIP